MIKRKTYTGSKVKMAAENLPRKIVVLETGLVKRGTILPLSNSLEILFMTVTRAKKKRIRLLTPEPATAFGFFAKGSPIMLDIMGAMEQWSDALSFHFDFTNDRGV